MNGARLLTLLPTLHTRRPLTVIGAAAGPGRVGGEDSPPSGKRGITQRD